MEFKDIHFGELKGTRSEQVVEYGVCGAHLARNSHYIEHLENGQTLKCVASALANIRAVQQLVVEAETEGEAVDLGFRFVHEHTGFDWTFWHAIAVLGLQAELFPAEVVVPEEGRRILDEMVRAFKPYLVPRILSSAVDPPCADGSARMKADPR